MTLLLGPLSLYPIETPGEVPELELPCRMAWEGGRVVTFLGDTEPALDFQLLQANGQPVPLGTADQVRVRFTTVRGRHVHTAVATIVDEDEGRCQLERAEGDLPAIDVYLPYALITWSTDHVQTIAGGFETPVTVYG